MRRKEQEFTTLFTKKMEAYFGSGCFVYKIPDSPMGGMGGRFLVPKPCDIVASVHGRMVGIEFKYRDKLCAFGVKDLRPSQVEGLTRIEKSGGLGLVVCAFKVGRGEYWVYWDHIQEFMKLGTIAKKGLERINTFKLLKQHGPAWNLPFQDLFVRISPSAWIE